ncbi:hypothetical protein T484DRAFT_1882086, partial [Baffinella frigidus]
MGAVLPMGTQLVAVSLLALLSRLETGTSLVALRGGGGSPQLLRRILQTQGSRMQDVVDHLSHPQGGQPRAGSPSAGDRLQEPPLVQDSRPQSPARMQRAAQTGPTPLGVGNITQPAPAGPLGGVQEAAPSIHTAPPPGSGEAFLIRANPVFGQAPAKEAVHEAGRGPAGGAGEQGPSSPSRAPAAPAQPPAVPPGEAGEHPWEAAWVKQMQEVVDKKIPHHRIATVAGEVASQG